jgi:GT2 family glycosyltransferase
MKLFIVVLCYRVVDLTIDCLHSLSKEVCRVPGTKVGVLENGTGGEAASRLQRAIEDNNWVSWCELTVVYPNRRFRGGNNLLIRPALESDNPPEYVLLLNADTNGRSSRRFVIRTGGGPACAGGSHGPSGPGTIARKQGNG